MCALILACECKINEILNVHICFDLEAIAFCHFVDDSRAFVASRNMMGVHLLVWVPLDVVLCFPLVIHFLLFGGAKNCLYLVATYFLMVYINIYIIIYIYINCGKCACIWNRG